MAVCMFWLLTYVGQGLDLAVGNRPVIIVQGTGQESASPTDYRHHGLRKKSELNTGGGGGNLLHLRIYPTDHLSSSSSSSPLSHRDDPWLLLNEEPRMSSWSPLLIEDMLREPRDIQTVFFALSPAVMNLLHNEAPQIGDPFLYEAHQNQQQQQQQQQRKKLRIDCKHSRSTVTPPILVCDDRREQRQSRTYEEMFEHRTFNAGQPKTELTHPRDYQNSGVVGVGASSGGNTGGGVGVGSVGGPFLSKPPPSSFGYEAVKPPGKRSHRGSIGRRSIGHSGDSGNSGHQPGPAPGNIASQLMLRSTRGSIQYDVPQIECPVSEDGMERFACPTADRMGRYHCIDDHVLCDGFIDCPTGEDEDRQACMFYKTTKAHLDVLADAILRWARGR